MGEPKPLASLSAGLLARKGAARPAMRRQPLGSGPAATFGQQGYDDLGWNDMGYDVDPQQSSEPARMVDLKPLLAEIPCGVIQMVTIQFPDPWFKKKHAKRRMVNVELIAAVVNKLAPGGRFFVQTDIEFLADEMFELIRAESRLTESPIEANPFPVRTEREKAVENKQLPVYRALWEKHEG